MTLTEIQEQTRQEKVDAANAIGNDRLRLYQRLLVARGLLRKEYRVRFARTCRFDFDNKRLISSDGRIALQWKLRLDPESPESYENQQTTTGCVTLRVITS